MDGPPDPHAWIASAGATQPPPPPVLSTLSASWLACSCLALLAFLSLFLSKGRRASMALSSFRYFKLEAYSIVGTFACALVGATLATAVAVRVAIVSGAMGHLFGVGRPALVLLGGAPPAVALAGSQTGAGLRACAKINAALKATLRPYLGPDGDPDR